MAITARVACLACTIALHALIFSSKRRPTIRFISAVPSFDAYHGIAPIASQPTRRNGRMAEEGVASAASVVCASVLSLSLPLRHIPVAQHIATCHWRAIPVAGSYIARGKRLCKPSVDGAKPRQCIVAGTEGAI